MAKRAPFGAKKSLVKGKKNLKYRIGFTVQEGGIGGTWEFELSNYSGRKGAPLREGFQQLKFTCN